jgi:GNAT superfamily N-acetyltransferase
VSLDADQLAELARNRGLRLKRSRVRKADTPGFGKFGLVDAAGAPVFGLNDKALTADADSIQGYIRGLEQQDWKKSLRQSGAGAPAKRTARTAVEPAAKPKKAPPPPPPEPVLREAKGRDAAQLAELFTLLDHQIAPEQVKKNLNALARSGEPVLVIEEANRLLGACGYHATPMPHRNPPVGRITVLVLAEDARGRGFGRRLVEAAERRLAKLGSGVVEVTSNDRLREAHAFYRHLGYERTSMRFAKSLGDR